MKSRKLHTIHDLIASNYTKKQMSDGTFLHSFTPENTNKVYEFVANSDDEIEVGARYSIGYQIDDSGRNIVELSCLSKNDVVVPSFSYLYAKQLSNEINSVNQGKNDSRVKYSAKEYYWGKKYAWRRFGLVISKGAFYNYMEDIGHPAIECITEEKSKGFSSNNKSIAYKEEGLELEMDKLISSAVKVGRYYSSPLYSKKFAIRGVNAITDKK